MMDGRCVEGEICIKRKKKRERRGEQGCTSWLMMKTSPVKGRGRGGNGKVGAWRREKPKWRGKKEVDWRAGLPLAWRSGARCARSLRPDAPLWCRSWGRSNSWQTQAFATTTRTRVQRQRSSWRDAATRGAGRGGCDDYGCGGGGGGGWMRPTTRRAQEEAAAHGPWKRLMLLPRRGLPTTTTTTRPCRGCDCVAAAGVVATGAVRCDWRCCCCDLAASIRREAAAEGGSRAWASAGPRRASDGGGHLRRP